MERLREILNCLPYMSRDIVDDTIHEKVLSYLSEYAYKGPGMVKVFLNWNVLDIIHVCKQAVKCITQSYNDGVEKASDYRIIALSIRFLAILLANDDKERASLFNRINEHHHDILDFILNNAFADEGLMRYSCIETLEQIVAYESGAKWFLSTKKSPQVVAACFLDPSTYVGGIIEKKILIFYAPTELFLHRHILIDLSKKGTCASSVTQNELLDYLISSLDLFEKIKGLLFNPHEDISERLAALQLIWTLLNSRTANAYWFIRSGQLLIRLDLLLIDRDKVVRSRTIDILCAVFEWVPEPISMFKNSVNSNDPILETFEFIIQDIVFSLLNTDTNFEMVTMAVNVIESSLLLVDRAANGKDSLASRLMDILIFLLGFSKIQQSKENAINNVENQNELNPDVQLIISNGTYEKLRTLFSNVRRNVSGGKSLILSILHAINAFSKKYESLIAATSIDTILDILFIPNYNSDQRILKAGLDILQIAIIGKIQNNRITDVNIINKTLQTIRNLLIDSRTECHGVILLLETMQTLLVEEIMGQYILDCKYAESWADAIISKFGDFRWEIRDSILEFVGRLFEMSDGRDPSVEFALKFNLPRMTISKITDEVAYIRASCLKTIQAMIHCPNGWKYVMSQGLLDQIAHKLPSMMKDTEAFVRQAVMDLIVYLIAERGCGTTLLADCNKEIINPLLLEKIMDDPDFYVRIGGCKFFETLWYHCEQDRTEFAQEISEENLLMYKDSSWFYSLGGDKLLIAAADDSSRLVRGEIIRILKRLKSFLEQMIHKRQSLSRFIDNIHDDDESQLSFSSLGQKHIEFYQKICLIDFNRLEATLDVEHLYKEALESVSPSMMMNSDMVKEGNEKNALDCYF
ncbi:7184_t:CDS:10 [Acaulospora morrowiae]|uniref:7184_t:CDS:1 n=1 Tax=Acaulospora morrowiae TaxID=94023 RepID=A0A9N8Z1A6_9GLOM|nr:7184_t:CDS:10 [Acaulospora morrowiae]